jgi:hypothetical protein
LGKLTAGDTLYLRNGTYNQSLTVGKSGISNAYITIKAQNDGQATIDGENVRAACRIDGKSYINVEGLICKNAYWSGERRASIYIEDSNHINVKRVSGYGGTSSGSGGGFGISFSSYVLLEDCATRSYARVLYNFNECDHITLRRCWGRYMGYTADTPRTVIQPYGSDDSIVENCIGVREGGTDIEGIHVWAHTYNPTCNRNRIYGNVMYNLNNSAYYINSASHIIHDNIFRNNVAINAEKGFWARADDNLTAENFTIVGSTDSGLIVDSGGTTLNIDVKNSSIAHNTEYGLKRSDSTLKQSYNNLYDNDAGNYSGTSKDTGETFDNPNYKTATYGKGAYLMVPSALKGQGEGGADIGAEVLYRYVDGKLSNTPLWPWPMEARICQETGYSVTYENGYSGCEKGGGLWKTLEGVYDGSPPPPPPSDTVPPAPPAIIEVK